MINMKSPVERVQEADKRKLPLRGEGNHCEFNKIPQSETTRAHQTTSIGDMKRND